MRKITRFVLVAALALLPGLGWAQGALTVADGTQTNTYGAFGFSRSGWHSEMVYPASMLSEMNGSYISSLTFYVGGTPTEGTMPNVTMRITETSNFAGYTSTSSSTSNNMFCTAQTSAYYNGSLEFAGGEMVITLDEPYLYEGGDLVLNFFSPSSTSYSSALVYGANQSVNHTGYDWSISSPTWSTYSTSYFLAKCTFEYSSAGTICRRVAGLTATEVTENSVSVSWNGVEGAEGYTVYLDGEEVDYTDDTAYTFDNLDALTAYTVGVVTDCGDDQQSAVRLLTVRTACSSDAIETPWSESMADASAIECWLKLDDDGDDRDWDIASGVARSRFHNNGGVDNWLISPLIHIGDELELAMLFWEAQGTYYVDYTAYKVLVSPSGDTARADFTDTLFSRTYNSSDIEQWEQASVSLSEYAGQTIRIAFRHHTGEDDNFYIRNLSIRNTDAPVASITGSPIADLQQEATIVAHLIEGSTSGLTYTWSSAREAAGDATMEAAGDTLRITYTGGQYDTITLVTTNGYGTHTATFAVYIRNCLAITSTEWVESFEIADALDCWTLLHFDGSNNTVWDRETGGSDGSYCMHSGYNTSADANAWLITPTIVVPEEADGLVLSYDYKALAFSTNPGVLQVRVSPTAGTDTASFSVLAGNHVGYETSSSVFSQGAVNLSPYAGQSIRVAFVHSSTDDNGTYVDNIRVRFSNIPVASIAGPSVVDAGTEVTFVASLIEGSTDGLTYTWTSARETAGDATMQADDDTLHITYTDGQYDTVTVMATNVYGEDSVSTTLYIRNCQPISTIPWKESFEMAEALECWTLLHYDGANGTTWNREASDATDGSYVMRSGFNTQTNADAWLITPAIVVPEAADGLALSYDYKALAYNSNVGVLQVRVAPNAGTDTADFSVLANSHVGNSDNLPFSQGMVNLDSYAGQSIRVAFVHSSYNDNGTYVDNVRLRFTNAPVADLTGPSAAALGDEVTFVGSLTEGSQAGLTYTWSSVRATAGEATLQPSDDTLRVTYTAGQFDTITLVATNGYGSDTVSKVVRIRNCEAVTEFPFTDDFEAEGCWTSVDADGDGFEWQLRSTVASALSSLNAHSGNDYMVSASYDVDGYSGLTPDNWLISQAIVLPADSAAITWYHMCAWSETPSEHYAVYVSTSNSVSDLQATTPVYETTLSSANYNNWQLGAADLSELAGQTVYVAFRHFNSEEKYFLCIDDFSVLHATATSGTSPVDPIGPVDPVVCNAPTNVHTTAVEATSATIDWASDANEWQVELVGGNSFTATSHPYTLQGLNANTAYSVRVRSVCYDADDEATYSDWSATVSFTTPATQGIEQADAEQLRLVPNPASGSVTLRCGTGMEGSRVEVIDLNGRVVMTVEQLNHNGQLDISRLASGQYFVRLVSATSVATAKLMVR